ncbi:MAG: cobalamin biosynthesis bifunctional protein CbiET, partial [Geminicoccus sp.]|nr:cobalamin biosynthesis bifunctional protein CbiET [Geminicoccus sp.]
MNAPWISVIGVGPEGPAGLTPAALAALEGCAHVVCAPRHEEILGA